MNAPFPMTSKLAHSIAMTDANISPDLHVTTGAADDDLAAFLQAIPGSTPFHSSIWGRAIEAATGHRWHLLVARNAVGVIVGILPLHHIRSRLFGSTLASTGFAVDGGILAQDARAIPLLADAAIALAGELGLTGAELRGGALPDDWRIDDHTYVGFSAPLLPSREEQLLSIPKRHRAEVRKGLANELRLSEGVSAMDRDAHFNAYSTSMRNLGTPMFPRRLFDCVLDAFGDKAGITSVYQDGEAVSSVLSLYWNGAVMPYWGGGTQAARGLRANEIVYFELMNSARERGMTSFDFGRSKVGSGPAAYKKNWGFEPQPLSYAKWNAAGTAVRDTNPTSAKYTLMVNNWKKMPLWLANRVGPFISRQLG